MNQAQGASDSFRQIAAAFFELEPGKTERDLFCTLSALSHYPTAPFEERHPVRSRVGRTRDWLVKLTLLRPGLSEECWFERLRDWQEHLDAYFRIAKANKPIPTSPGDQKSSENLSASLAKFGPVQVEREIAEETGDPKPKWNLNATSLGAERITLLFDLLRILDAKFSMLLTLNSVLVAILGVSVKETADLFTNYPATDSFIDLRVKWVVGSLAQFCLGVLITLCLCNIWHAFRGFRRIVWGDLSKMTPEETNKGEQQFADFLILSLARRTVMFRIVSQTTLCVFAGFLVFAVLGVGGFVYRLSAQHDLESDQLIHQMNPRIQIPQPPPQAITAFPPHPSDERQRRTRKDPSHRYSHTTAGTNSHRGPDSLRPWP